MGWFTNFVPTVGWGVPTLPPPTGDLIIPIVMVGASNTAGGDDSPSAVLTSEDSPSGVVIWKVGDGSSGVIEPIDINGGGIYRPGGNQSNANTPASTSSAINFAAAVHAATGATCVLVPMAVGGRGVWTGSTVPESGPWDPDGVGPIWDPEVGTSATTDPGSLYKALADDSGNGKSIIQNYFETALAASAYSGYSLQDPIFYGYPMNENDRGAPHDVAVDRCMRAITDIRDRWGVSTAPWVITSPPPEWSATNITRDAKISACLWEVANRLPYCSYVEGPVGGQHPTEQIHYSNAGYRAMGTLAFGGLAAAQANTSAPNRLVDWVDGLTTPPDRVFGLHRALSTYTGPAVEVSNGLTTTDIGFDSDGYLDYTALLAHAALNGNTAHVTKAYDHMGSGAELIPEGTGEGTIVREVNGEPQVVLQGNHPTWGYEDNNILYYDSSVTLTDASALMFCGNFADGGNRVIVAGANNSVALFGSGSEIRARYSSNTPVGYTPDFYEPSWATDHRALFTLYTDNGDLYEAGVDVMPTTTTGISYGSTGVAVGGRTGQTNRYASQDIFLVAVWVTAPTGAARDEVIAATGQLDKAYDIEII